MARLRLSPIRTTDTLPSHVGKVLLFCEGDTEQNYFDYFQEVFQHEAFKYSDIVIETVPGNGNAQTVLNKADEFFSDDQNVQRFQDYRKYLVFDCDAPDNVQNVICTALQSPIHVLKCLPKQCKIVIGTDERNHFRLSCKAGGIV